jgi:glycosyltransferase involved in cell wall biosynthesis
MMTTLSEPQTVPTRFANRRVAAVVYSHFPSDPRPRRAAEALVRNGARVEVICLKERDDEPQHEVFNGVDVTRVPLKHRRGGKLAYLARYAGFILLAGMILAYRSIRSRFHLVHVHNMPDALVFSALVPKLLGAKVILDLHDPMPELFMTIFGFGAKGRAVRLLKMLEKWSLGFADAVVTTNEAFRKLFTGRSCAPEKITTVMNSPDEEIFSLSKVSKVARRDNSTPFVIMYHGSLVERHGLELAVKALAKLGDIVPNAELRIFGNRTPYLEQVLDLARSAGLSDAIHYLGPKDLSQIAMAIRNCDIGIIPNQKNTFTELNMPTRIFEFLSQGKLVIAPRTMGILDYFTPKDLLFFELGDADDLAAKIAYAFRNPDEMVKLVERGQEVYRLHRWSVEQVRFVDLVDKVLRSARGITVHA